MKPTLLLNMSFEALTVISWKRAILLMLSGKVEVIESYDQEVHSVSRSFRLPSVIRLRRYARLRRHARTIRLSRTNIFIRDAYECQYCGDGENEVKLTLDHVIPLLYGGSKDWHNLVTACQSCNQKKGGRTPLQAGMRLIQNPAKPNRRLFINYALTLTNDPPQVWRTYLAEDVEEV